MKIKDKENLPEVTKRILDVIESRFDGNVLQFSLSLGLSNSNRINRLFFQDKRNGNYPMPSIDIIILISNTFNITTDWLLKGDLGKNKQNVNNITIDAKKVTGNNNVTNSHDVTSDNGTAYLEIIKQQQSQIAKLMELIK